MTHVLKYVLTKDDRRYQRTVTHVRGLTARPVWPMEELPKKYQDKLLEIQSNWEKVLVHVNSQPSPPVDPLTHRRRIYTEDQAKVVATVWGKKFIQTLAALAYFHQDDLKKKMNSSFS